MIKGQGFVCYNNTQFLKRKYLGNDPYHSIHYVNDKYKYLMKYEYKYTYRNINIEKIYLNIIN